MQHSRYQGLSSNMLEPAKASCDAEGKQDGEGMQLPKAVLHEVFSTKTGEAGLSQCGTSCCTSNPSAEQGTEPVGSSQGGTK